MREIDEVLDYWLGPEPATAAEAQGRMGRWFGGSPELDHEIRERFGARVQSARAGELDAWARTPRGTLALIVLIDQFSRNVYRDSAEAFACDGKALAHARDGYASGRFEGFGTIEHMFATLPFEHAEDMDAQRQSVMLAVRHALAAPPELKDIGVYIVDWARRHLDVVARFGRFPHRNALLGRASTPAETEYMAYLKLAKQWL